MPALDAIIDDLTVLEDWEERYAYLIDLGRSLDPLPDEARTEQNRVRGCVSQVWLLTRVHASPEGPRLTFIGDSDAHIVRGLVALALAIYSGKTAQEIAKIDAASIFERLGLTAHLTPQRSNGVRALVQRIRSDAEQALAADASAAR